MVDSYVVDDVYCKKYFAERISSFTLDSDINGSMVFSC